MCACVTEFFDGGRLLYQCARCRGEHPHDEHAATRDRRPCPKCGSLIAGSSRYCYSCAGDITWANEQARRDERRRRR